MGQFTPEELQELVKAGDITEANIGQLPEEDRNQAAFILARSKERGGLMSNPEGVSGGMPMPSNAMAIPSAIKGMLTGGGAGDAARKVWNGAGPLAAEVGTFAALSSVDAPEWMKYFLSRGVGRGVPKVGPGKGVGLKAPSGPPTKSPVFGRQPRTNPPNLEKGRTNFDPKDPGNSMDVVKKGVQNDFKGPVSIKKPTDNFRKEEFPPGTTKSTPPADFKKAQEASAESQGDPRSIESIQAEIAKKLKEADAKRSVQLKKPRKK